MTIRKLFIEWLTGSRYLQWLEHGQLQLRQDYETRLAEKDHIIHEKTVELAGLKLECDRMRLVLLPLGSPVGAIYAERFQQQRPAGPPVPEFDGPLDWQAELQRMMNSEESNGIHGEGREKVNQPGTDDAAQPQPRVDGLEV